MAKKMRTPQQRISKVRIQAMYLAKRSLFLLARNMITVEILRRSIYQEHQSIIIMVMITLQMGVRHYTVHTIRLLNLKMSWGKDAEPSLVS